MNKLLALPLLSLLFATTGCNAPYDPEEERDFIIYFYLDYNHNDMENPYYKCWWDFNKVFTKRDINLVDPVNDAADPYYPTFLGWSLNSLVDEEQYLFDFNTPITEEEAVGGYIELYGIFVRNIDQ